MGEDSRAAVPSTSLRACPERSEGTGPGCPEAPRPEGRGGDLVLSLRRELRPNSRLHFTNTAPPMRVEATDDASAAYTQLNRYGCANRDTVGYWVTTLERQRSDAQPRTVTLTIYPYWSGDSKTQSVTFADVPLPPRQNVDDVVDASRQVVRY